MTEPRRQYEPDYEVDGPFFPRSRGGRVAFIAVAIVAIACLCAAFAPFNPF